MGPAGTENSIGERAPTLASVGILLASIFCLRVKIGASQKIKAILSLRMGERALSSGILPPNCSRCLNLSSSIPSVLSLMILLVKVCIKGDNYVLGNDESTIESSESLSDLLDLT